MTGVLGSHVLEWKGLHDGKRNYEIYHPWSCQSFDGGSSHPNCDIDFEIMGRGDEAFGWEDDCELDLHKPGLFVVERWVAGDDSALELRTLLKILVLAGNLHQAHHFVKSLYFPLPKSQWKYVKNPNDLAGYDPSMTEFWQVGTPKFALAGFCAGIFKVTAVLS